MMKLFDRKKKILGNKGFSLVELIIVIAIMAVLIAVLAPQYLKYVDKSRQSADDTTAETLLKAVQVAASDEAFMTAMTTNVTVVFDETSTRITADTTGGLLDTALDETFGATVWPAKVITSNTYKSSTNHGTYTITVSYADSSVNGVWSA